MRIQVGDKVKFRNGIAIYEVLRINGFSRIAKLAKGSDRYDGELNRLEIVEKQPQRAKLLGMSGSLYRGKYSILKEQIKGLRNGLDDQAEAILEEIRGKYWLVDTGAEICIDAKKNLQQEDFLAVFEYTDSCSKNKAMILVALWLLNKTGLKKEQEDKTAEIEKIQNQIDKLEVKKQEIST